MSSFISCSYNTDTRRLTVTSPVVADTSGTALTFEVDNFRNPYSGKPRTGYYVVTTDSADGRIDSSLIAGITMTV